MGRPKLRRPAWRNRRPPRHQAQPYIRRPQPSSSAPPSDTDDADNARSRCERAVLDLERTLRLFESIDEAFDRCMAAADASDAALEAPAYRPVLENLIAGCQRGMRALSSAATAALEVAIHTGPVLGAEASMQARYEIEALLADCRRDLVAHTTRRDELYRELETAHELVATCGERAIVHAECLMVEIVEVDDEIDELTPTIARLERALGRL